MIFSKKNKILCSISNIFIENGLKKEDEKVFYKNSDQKSFIYINSETIKTLENNKIYITSTNAALINGQQSTHIPHLIKESLLKIKNEKKKVKKVKEIFVKQIEEVLNDYIFCLERLI